MTDELTELLDTSIYKEVASNALYTAGQSKATDPDSKKLMKELAEEELKHSEWLKGLKDKGLKEDDLRVDEVPNLMISEYLTTGEAFEDAGLQDTLIFAMKHEQQAIEFYLRLMSVIRDETTKRLCERLVQEELRHKLRLEILYDDLFYREN